MQRPTPFFREAGSGPGVVCLHSNASSSSQWRALVDFLAPKFHVLAADSFGAGKSPVWPTEHSVSLQDEVALLEPVFARAGDPFALVAHSYGAVAGAANPASAAKCFIDFWMGEGTWDHTPETRKSPIIASVANLHGWERALFDDPTPLDAFSKLNFPVLFMMGKNSPASSRGVGRLLIRVLPQVQVVEFEGLGHMGPVTHPELVNETISRFLERG